MLIANDVFDHAMHDQLVKATEANAAGAGGSERPAASDEEQNGCNHLHHDSHPSAARRARRGFRHPFRGRHRGSIARPITAMTALMKRLAGGDTSVRAAAILQKDEVGDMARAVEIFREGMIESVRLGAAHREEQEKKEQRQRTVEGNPGGFDRVVRRSLDTLAEAAARMRQPPRACRRPPKQSPSRRRCQHCRANVRQSGA
jgi:hypothetical protein